MFSWLLQLSLLGRLETDLCTELSDGTVQPPSRLQLYLAVCKLLDTAMALPQETLPHFQLYVHVGTSIDYQFLVLGGREGGGLGPLIYITCMYFFVISCDSSVYNIVL